MYVRSPQGRKNVNIALEVCTSLIHSTVYSQLQSGLVNYIACVRKEHEHINCCTVLLEIYEREM